MTKRGNRPSCKNKNREIDWVQPAFVLLVKRLRVKDIDPPSDGVTEAEVGLPVWQKYSHSGLVWNVWTLPQM